MSLTYFRHAEAQASPAKITFQHLREKKQKHHAITALTAYDYVSARLVDEAGIDLILVGDSLAMVILGHDNTLPVTMAEMLHHTRAVRRAVKRAMVIADMPYGSYHVSSQEGVANAIRFIKNAGAEAVKVEGGANRIALIEQLMDAEIPVIGHLGLTPQSVHRIGDYKVQARSAADINQLMNDAHALEAAGASAIVLEGIPREVAAKITQEIGIPTIGIGAGPDCDGQILVFHDLMHLSFSRPAKFVRPYADASTLFRNALENYVHDVEQRIFPSDKESYHLPEDVVVPALVESIDKRTHTQSRTQVVKVIADVRSASKKLRAMGRTIGLVPTMGALHEGHLSLVRAAKATCDAVVVSIFVNPAQFGPNEDFSLYPRTFEADCALLAGEEVTLIFAPAPEEMYPAGASTFVLAEGISTRLDGASRPGHFRGVTTVVTKLFHIVAPDKAFFGQKDAAQVAILRKMVRDLDFDLELVVCPTVREHDGLAMSSRNRYLSPEERKNALVLHQILRHVEREISLGITNSEELLQAGKLLMAKERDIRLDYFKIVDPNTLDDIQDVCSGGLVAIAAFAGTTRLIDNLLVPSPVTTSQPDTQSQELARYSR